MEEDRSNIEHKSAQQVGPVNALEDWTVWWLATAGFFLLVGASFGLFLPTIVATMGYSPTVTLLLCVPPSFISVTISFFVMRSVHSGLVPFLSFDFWHRHSDVTRDRFWHIVGPVSMGIIGFIIAILTMNPYIRYLSV